MLKYKQPGPSILKPLFLMVLSFGFTFLFKKEKKAIRETTSIFEQASFVSSTADEPKTEKPLIIFETKIIRTKPAATTRQKTIIFKFKIATVNPLPSAPPLPPPVEELQESDASAILEDPAARLHSFVSVKPQEIEFTIIDIKPIVPVNNNTGKLTPYIPASTFYYPDIPEPAPTVNKKQVSI